jgi:hypothetical protein
VPPRCYPPDPQFSPERHAERTVFEALRDQLPNACALFYSVGLLEDSREHEADFVVAWPGEGVAVIEVKGGHVTRERGQWFQASGGSRHEILNPMTQAQDCRHVLQRYARRADLPEVVRSRYAHLAAFPYSVVPNDWQAPDCPRDLLIAKSEMSTAAASVRSALSRHGNGQGLTERACGELEDLLERDLLGQTSLLSAAEEHEQRVDQMTRDQTKVLENLRHYRRLKVIGGAGTGKTWLAMEQARRLAKNGERVALVCYSRGLARFFERLTATWPNRERPAYVGLFHQLPILWGATPGPDDDSDYWEHRLPEELGRLAAAKPVAELFDSVVIDEGQDFGDLWWPPTLACLRDPEKGGLFVFLDEAQRVFARQGEVPIPLPPYALSENIRNTKNIAQTFGSLSGEKMRYRCGDGPPVRFVQCATEDAASVADDQIDLLLDRDGWAPSDIALLTTGRRHNEQINVVSTGNWASYWDDFFAGTDVFYGHVLGFKGLERPVVVLAVNGFKDLSRAREMLYVGLSRSRTQLVVCGDLALIAKVDGEGVKRRLQAASRSQ